MAQHGLGRQPTWLNLENAAHSPQFAIADWPITGAG